MEKNIRDKKIIKAPPHMAKKKERSVNDQADHGKYLKTLTKLFFFSFFFCGVQERRLIGILDSLIPNSNPLLLEPCLITIVTKLLIFRGQQYKYFLII